MYAKQVAAEAEIRSVKTGGTGDHITTERLQRAEAKAKTYGEQAASLYDLALQMEKKHNDGKTAYARMKPGLIKGIFATAVAAEIISIPVLLMSCVMMTKPAHPKHSPASA